ncbi:MAG TPA: ABC transporter permease, partial [Steroidobacteraceae bacterium]
MASAVNESARGFIASAAREWRFLRGSPWDMALATWLPLLCLMLLAWLLSSGVVRKLPVAVVDDDRSTTSREITRLLGATPALAVTARPHTLAAAWPLVRSGDIYAVIYVPARTTRDAERGETATIFAYYDATHPTAGQAAFRDASAAVQEMGVRFARGQIARSRGPSVVRPAPILVQGSTTDNAASSYEPFLLGLLFPAVILFAVCLSMTSAFGRELRNGSAPEWLHSSGDALIPAVAGKMAPYLALAGLQGFLGLTWIAGVRGEAAHSSVPMLLIGQMALYLGYAAIA